MGVLQASLKLQGHKLDQAVELPGSLAMHIPGAHIPVHCLLLLSVNTGMLILGLFSICMSVFSQTSHSLPRLWISWRLSFACLDVKTQLCMHGGVKL